MKRIIADYETYEKDIFSGNSVNITEAYFSGFKFVDNEKVFFMNYQLLTEDTKTINFITNFLADDLDEIMLLESSYKYYESSGLSHSHSVPSLMPLSTFYVEKEGDLDYYTVYCRILLMKEKDTTVYKLTFNKSSFMSIMLGYNQLMNYSNIDYNITDLTNVILPETKTEKINQSYKYIVRYMYVEIPKKLPLFNKDKVNLICLISTTLKDANDNHFRLFYKIYISYKDFKTLKESKYTTDMKKFLEYDKSLEKDRTYLNSMIGDVNIQISRKSNYPITKKLLYAIPYENNEIDPVYVEFTEDAFNEFVDSVNKYLFK